MKVNKIWITKKWLWRCNVYTWNDLYDELVDINLLNLIEKLKKIDYKWEKVKFEWFNNL